MELALAVDIGGTKVAAGLVDRDGVVVRAAQAPTAAHGTGDALFEDVTRLVTEVVGDDRPVVCGVGCGGPMDLGGEHVSPLNIPAWRDFPLRARLAGVTDLPVFVDNDAKALALGEGWKGAAAGRRNYLGMVVSTGVGGGLVCGCGARGCLEAEISGTAIAAITGRPPADAGPDVIAHAGLLLGRGIASVANLLDLQLAVVSGSVALGWWPPSGGGRSAWPDSRPALRPPGRPTRRCAGGSGRRLATRRTARRRWRRRT